MEPLNTSNNPEAAEQSNAVDTAIAVPRVIKFGFKDFRQSNGKWFAVCNTCRKVLSDKTGVSSSFTK